MDMNCLTPYNRTKTRSKDLTDMTFNKLFVLGGDCKDHRGKHYYNCQCECGSVFSVRQDALTTGNTKSCGCYFHSEQAKQHYKNIATTHGMRFTRTYKSWVNMKQRCLNPKAHNFDNYGGRGVTIHPEWIKSFEAFYEYLGDRPEGMSIDRINSHGNYEPGNVKWSTASEQNKNQRRYYK